LLLCNVRTNVIDKGEMKMCRIIRYGAVKTTVFKGDKVSCILELSKLVDRYESEGRTVRLEWEAITVFANELYLWHFSIEE
jgi:hypothetical protein